MTGKEIERHLKTVLNARSRREAVRILADRIGGWNPSKLCRRLHTFLETGDAPPALIEAIRERVAPAAFDAVLAEMRLRQQAHADRQRLTQALVRQARAGVHLWVEHARGRPSQICIVAMTGLDRWKRIPLPSQLPVRDWRDQVEVVARACQDWLEEHGSHCLMFGRVEGFVYRPTPWSSYRFSIDGRLCSGDLGAWSEPAADYSVR